VTIKITADPIENEVREEPDHNKSYTNVDVMESS